MPESDVDYLPDPVDNFLFIDVYEQMVKSRMRSGYTEEQATAKINGWLHQLAKSWGLPVAEMEPQPGMGLSMSEAAELRRAWRNW